MSAQSGPPHPSPEALSRSPAHRRTLTVALPILIVLLAIYAVSFGYQRLMAPAPATPIGPDWPPSQPDGVLPDLSPARANISVQQPPSPFRFTEVASQSGIDFVHFAGMTKDKYFPTAYGSGLAIFDYDSDGRLDLYFATGTLLPVGSAATGTNRLYRNQGGGQFVETTKAAGLAFAGYCHGVVTADFDNDGDPDVLLCNNGPGVLYQNNGNGTFRDISKQAGINSEHWSTGGAVLDYDNDGDLDVYVANYGHWKLPDDDIFCGGSRAPEAPGPGKVRIYCSPTTIRPARHILYRNNGNCTFTDVTEAAGLTRSDGRGLGVVAADLNGDGRIDLYVANDMCPNFVYLNRGNGTFEDATDSSGAGYGPKGETRAGMGVDAEDVNGDGRTDLLVTNFWAEGAGLFMSVGPGLFEDQAKKTGIYYDSVSWVGWGCALGDFDSDGWPDCFISNGHIDDNLKQMNRYFNTYMEPPLLHRNQNGAKFELATRNAGTYFDSDHVGRGVAYGDLDNDGDIDLVVSHKDAAPAVLRNDTKTSNHWIRLWLSGTRSNRDAVGARVEVEAAGRTIVRQQKGGSSLGSSHDPRLLIGIGEAKSVDRVTIRWPSGQIDRHQGLSTEATWKIREGAPAPERITLPN